MACRRVVRALTRGMLRLVGRATNRHPVLLAPEARLDEITLDVRHDYRVDDGVVSLDILPPGPGTLHARLFGYAGSFPGDVLWSGPARACADRATMRVDWESGRVTLDGDPWGDTPSIEGRRICIDITWAGAQGRRRRRTGHYRPGSAAPAGADYYQGETYVDHAAVEAEEARHTLTLLRRFDGAGPVLEVGCATGGTLEALRAQGFVAQGVDISAWAVAQANERLGTGAAHLCDVEKDPFPQSVVDAAPYGTLILWAVFEHFQDPFGTLDRLRPLVQDGGLLIINTTNAQSLTQALFGSDWEGHFDPTHYGVLAVGAQSLRERLPSMGWEIVHMKTHAIWTGSADPTHAVLRDTYANDARFRALLAERDAGDFLILVARRVGASP